MVLELKQKTRTAAEWLMSDVTGGVVPTALVQTGSGMHADGVLDQQVKIFPLAELPGMPEEPSAAAHPCRLIFGYTAERPVIIVEGRRHLYEGLGVLPCVLPVTAAAAAGIENIILLSACGAVIPASHLVRSWS